MVSLKGCGTDWRGLAQPSKAAAPHPWKKLPCDLLDVMSLKPTLSPGTAVSSAILLGLPCWLWAWTP